jgi:hypothetical protein
MNRWLPLIAILAVLAIVAAIVVPPIYRGMLFRRDCRELISASEAGDIVTDGRGLRSGTATDR